MHKRYLAAVAAALAALMIAGCGQSSAPSSPSSPSAPAAKKSIKIGLDIPISGNVAWMGSDYEQGATIAVDEINAAGGIDGHKLELTKADGACAPGPAVTAARHLVDVEKVDVIMGELCSSATLAVEAILPQLQVPNVTVTSTNPKISQQAGKGGNPWQFRLNVDDSIMAHSFAATIARAGVKSIALFAVNDDFGRGAVDAYKKEFQPLNVTVGNVEFYAHGEPDYRAMLAQVKQANPDAVLLVMEANDAAVFMRQFKELQMPQKVFARGSVVTSEFLEQIKDNKSLGEGIQEASMWNVGIDTPENKALNDAYQKRWNRGTTANGAMAYYGVKAIAAALKASGQFDAKGIRDGLEKVDYQSGIGHIKFDDHHQAHPLMTIATIKDGKIEVGSTIPTE